MSFFKNLFGSDKKKGPTFTKNYQDSTILINELLSLKNKTQDKSIQDEIDFDIQMIKIGDSGEKNVYYELQNSFINMYVLHNVVFKHGDMKAQLDFILITEKFICILETKKLNGNIEITNSGDFIRHFTNSNGKVYKKEGMYSPITQNQRHVRLLDNLLKSNGIIKNIPIFSLVVIANPKSIIEHKYAKKEIKAQIVKHDQLVEKLKSMIVNTPSGNIAQTHMFDISAFIVHKIINEENAFVTKYKQKINMNTNVNQKFETPIVNNKSDYIRTKLVEYRLIKSREENIKAYIIFSNNEMEELINHMPKNKNEFLKCKGFGEAKYNKYGTDILKIINNIK